MFGAPWSSVTAVVGGRERPVSRGQVRGSFLEQICEHCSFLSVGSAGYCVVVVGEGKTAILKGAARATDHTEYLAVEDALRKAGFQWRVYERANGRKVIKRL